MRATFPIVCAVVLVAVFAACGGGGSSKDDAGVNTEPLCSLSAPATCPTPAPTYADVKPIFTQSCVGCHNDDPNGPWSLQDYEHIADWQEVVGQMVADCEMPPADSGVTMTEADRLKILTWFQCGARP